MFAYAGLAGYLRMRHLIHCIKALCVVDKERKFP